MKLNLLSYTEQQTMPKASEEAEILTFLQRLLTTKFQKGPLGPLWRLQGRKICSIYGKKEKISRHLDHLNPFLHISDHF